MRFIIINLLPPEIGAVVEALRSSLNEAAGTREALRYPPHVTLRTGLVCPDSEAEAVAQRFLKHASGLTSVPIKTAGTFVAPYSVNGQSRVMFGWQVKIIPDLVELHEKLLAFQEYRKGPQDHFRPHVSIAYHDLTPAGMVLIQERVRNRKLEFPDLEWTINHVALFVEKEGLWVEYQRTQMRASMESRGT